VEYLMVDEKIIQDIKNLAGKSEREPSDALLMFEFAKQLADENEDLKEELEDVDILVQMVVTDIDYHYWVKMGDGKLDYGEGDADDPSVTMSATGATWTGLVTGDIDSTSAYMSGDLVIDGNLQDAIAYGEIMGIVGDEFPSD